MKPGDTYREWTIEEQLGQGAFGKVFKVVRRELGHSYYSALKVIRVAPQKGDYYDLKNQGMSDDDINIYYKSIVKDFTTELRVMDALKGHSNIVSYETHTIEKNTDGVGWTIYILMELLTPLEQYLDQHTMDADDVVRLGVDMCTALEACGKFNIIHRDIKPANIFVSKFGSFKLGDFGISRQLEKTEGNLSKKGTFNYMAPEVYWGKPYNQTVDIYSLGIVLYRLLNQGRLPLLPPAPEPLNYLSSNNALEQRMSGKPFPPPCNADKQLAAMVLKACAFDPKERYQTASEMKKALSELTAKQETVKPTPKPVSIDIDDAETEESDTQSVFGDHITQKTEVKPDEPPTYIKREQEEEKRTDIRTDKPPASAKQNPQKKLVTAPKPYQYRQGQSSPASSKPKTNTKPSASTKQKKKTLDKIIKYSLIGICTSAFVIIICVFLSANNPKKNNIATVNETTVQPNTETPSTTESLKEIAETDEVLVAGDNISGYDFSDWRNISQISARNQTVVGLTDDGTIKSTEYYLNYASDEYHGPYNSTGNDYSDIFNWKNIISVAIGDDHTVGLKKDGSVVATGDLYLDYGQYDVSGWKNITAVAAGDDYTVGLKKDGTVVATGDNYRDRCKVSNWNNITAVAAGYDHTVGLKKDGTVVATGDNYWDQCKVSNWNNITAVAAGAFITIGLKKDSSVVSTQYNDEVSKWTNIKTIAVGTGFIVGLKEDGSVVSTQYNDEVSKWTNIKAIAAGNNFIVGLKK